MLSKFYKFTTVLYKLHKQDMEKKRWSNNNKNAGTVSCTVFVFIIKFSQKVLSVLISTKGQQDYVLFPYLYLWQIKFCIQK